MRVFSQINNCQQKNKQKNKTKSGAPLLGLAKSIYYGINTTLVSVKKSILYVSSKKPFLLGELRVKNQSLWEESSQDSSCLFAFITITLRSPPFTRIRSTVQ